MKVPTLVGLPEINPVLAFNFSPVGNRMAPKEVGEPLAVIWWETLAPRFTDTAPRSLVITSPVGGGGATGFTVILRLAEPVPAEFDAEIDDVKVPAVLGVPEITPVEVLTDNPEGKLLAL